MSTLLHSLCLTSPHLRTYPRNPALFLPTSYSVPCSSTRAISTRHNHYLPLSNGFTRRKRPIVAVGLLLGVFSLGAGYYMYSAILLPRAANDAAWPEGVASDLRQALLAQEKNDLQITEAFLRRALSTLHSVPLSRIPTGPDNRDTHASSISGNHSQALLKLSGVSISLGEVLERSGKRLEAFEVYRDALEHLDRSRLPGQAESPTGIATSSFSVPRPATNKPNHDQLSLSLRALSLAWKLASMAGDGHAPQGGERRPREGEEEKWLVRCVEEVLRMPGVREWLDGVRSTLQSEDNSLLSSVRRVELASPFEALGSLYARRGNIEFAVPLYLQAISFLMAPQPTESGKSKASREDRCRAAQVMNSLSEALMQYVPVSTSVPARPETEDQLRKAEEKRSQAEAWARKGLDILEREVRNSGILQVRRGGEGVDICEIALGAAYYNVALLRELAHDHKTAGDMYKAAAAQCRAVGLNEGLGLAEEGLRRCAAVNCR